MHFVCGQQAKRGVSPSTLLISRQVAMSPNAAIPDHGCFPLALCLSLEFVCASQEEPAHADLALKSRALAGSSDKYSGHSALLWLPLCDSQTRLGCAHHPCPPFPTAQSPPGCEEHQPEPRRESQVPKWHFTPLRVQTLLLWDQETARRDTSLTEAPRALES